tara:strand:+ start:7573 stop:7680 length:108 start_codon:yes stop_codon:yes gene_type:complete
MKEEEVEKEINYKIIYRNEEIMVAINKKYMKDEEE